ncbi:MAG: hypothetical protein JSU89_08200 [Myxococcales bacterium]|nr:MAG: hypothetical protein JSU89_08200 [Myxococcales bacterium]
MPGGRIEPAARVTGPPPLLWLAWLCAGATITYVVGAPFWAADYPMMTDFPFHTASSAVLRHYTDADWHFREQFVFQMFAVPYVTLYAVSAIFMVVLPPVVATKLAAALLLSLLPIGLMVLCWGLRKSPLLGLWGLVPVWGVLTHWGFINFVAAMGLFAMALGLALRIVDRPSVKLQGALIAVLILLFFTHVFRFPFAVGMIVVVGLVMRDRVESIKGLFIPAGVAIALFLAWWLTRTELLASEIRWVWPPQWSRMSDASGYVSNIFIGDEDTEMFRRTTLLFALTAAALLAIAIARLRSWPKGGWVVPAHVIVGVAILVSLGLYLILPMEIGAWWYVFPREITAALFLVPALLPNLPRKTWAHLGFVIWTAVGVAPLAELVTDAHREFSTTTVHFREIIRELPKAPKLLYLVYDQQGSRAQNSPYVHLPAYAQAERGGWLSFHFAQFGASPFRYRDPTDPNAVVPPKTPVRWEWSPQLFQLDQHGDFFDWFLIRRVSSPGSLFASDPSIRRVAHFENWWLYHRPRGPTGPPSETP